MAEDMGERTEKPTPKKRSEARSRGQVAKSQELSTVALLGTGTLLVVTLGAGMMETFAGTLRHGLETLRRAEYAEAGESARHTVDALRTTGLTVLPFFVGLAVVAYLSQLGQVGWLFTTKPLKPKWSKLNPAAGLKRIFGARNAVKSAGHMAQMVVAAAVAAGVIGARLPRLMSLSRLSASAGLLVAGQVALEILLLLLAVLVVLAAADFILQRWQHTRDLKMTKQEIKDERRSMEGDPLVKKKRLQMAYQIAMQRVGAAVPRADVVVTNPTHFAVALRYDPERMRSPRVVAKGADVLALRIRQVAALHAVPIVERPALARGLYWGVDVGREIPPEFFEAVAEILAYVYRTARTAAA